MNTLRIAGVSIFISAFLPVPASAAVIINEFLYDAAGTDTDQEYVELLNTGTSDIDLTKYKINDGSNHSLNVPPKNGGTGSIIVTPGGYALLVDNAANFLIAHPGFSGTIIDTVLSLSNTAATIVLLDESNAAVDSVSYTKDQGGNGDGNSVQRSGSSWVVAVPTPLSANAAASTPGETTTVATTTAATTTTTQSSTSNTNTIVSSYVPPPAASLFADGGDDRTVIVGADTEFSGRAYNRTQEIVEKVRFNWNFGDGTTAEGAAVLHHFSYPGKYAVILTIAEHTSAASDRIVVTAVPAQLVFSVNADASVSIENQEHRDIDVSRWIIRSYSQSFTLPDDTQILAGQTLRISNTTLGFTVGPQTELLYPNGTAVDFMPPTPVPIATMPVSAIASASAPAAPAFQSAVPKKAAPAIEPLDTPEDAAEMSEEDRRSTTSLQVAAAGSMSTDSYIWWLGAFGIALLACGAAFAVRHMQKKEWNIIDESGGDV